MRPFECPGRKTTGRSDNLWATSEIHGQRAASLMAPFTIRPFQRCPWDRNGFTRRDFLRTLPWPLGLYGGLALTSGFPFIRHASGTLFEPPQTKPPLFEEVAPSKTGISWRHVTGRSPQYYLPQTTAAGCAFFTYGYYAPGSSFSARLFDFDSDAELDLFVVRFADFTKSKRVFCGNERTGKRYNCSPRSYPSARSWLFHNNGDGTFRDVSMESGIGKVLGKAWGVVATDINNDGWMDLFVANDTVQNYLFLNDKVKFSEN